MDFDSFQFVSNHRVQEYHSRLLDILSEPADIEEQFKIPEIERAEALEALGISEFYKGDYQLAQNHFIQCLAYSFDAKVRPPGRHCMLLIYLAISKFRLGDLQSSEEDLQQAAAIAQIASLTELQAMALANRALILGRKEVYQAAIAVGKQAVDLAGSVVYKYSFQYRQYVKILISLYIKTQEYHKAEVLLEESTFPEKVYGSFKILVVALERIIIEVGLHMATGKFSKAQSILFSAYNKMYPHLNTTSNNKDSLAIENKLDDNSSLLLNSEADDDDDEASAGQKLETYLYRVQIIYNLCVLHQLTFTSTSSLSASLSHSQDDNSVQKNQPNDMNSLNMLKDLIEIIKAIVFKLYQRYIKTSQDPVTNQVVPFYLPPTEVNNDHNFLPTDMLHSAMALYSSVLMSFAEMKYQSEIDISVGNNIQCMQSNLRKKSENRGESKEEKAQEQYPMNKINIIEHDQTLRTKLKSIEDMYQKAIQIFALLKDSSSTLQNNNENDLDSLLSGHAIDKRSRSNSMRSSQSAIVIDHMFNTDMMMSYDMFNNFQLFSSLHFMDYNDDNAENIQSSIIGDASKIIEAHGIEFNAQTGVLLNHGTGGRNRLAKADLNNSRPVTTDYSQYNNNLNAAPTSSSYLADRMDRISTKADYLLMSEKIGRDEVAAWIQWAIANCHSISLGNLGMSIITGKEFKALNPIQPPAAVSAAHNKSFSTASSSTISVDDDPGLPSPALLIEVRNRLLEVDVRLSFAYEHDDVYNYGELEYRVVILILLVKITSQLGMKADVAPLLINLHKAADLLYNKKPCVESCVYMCLQAKFKAEYEEWLTSPFLAKDELAHHYVNTLLPLVKSYFKYSEKLPLGASCIEIRKDALKKMINIYTLASQCSSSATSGNGSKPTTAGPSSNHSVQSAGSGSTLVSKDKQFTNDELLAMDEHAIEEYEQDPNWVVKYGKARALAYFRKMKAIMQEASNDSY